MVDFPKSFRLVPLSKSTVENEASKKQFSDNYINYGPQQISQLFGNKSLSSITSLKMCVKSN